MAFRKEVTLSLQTFLFLAVFAIGLGAFYRLPGLERRPMHADEAILAVKLGEFWDTGHFAYDPHDYHGPALHQVSWLWGHLARWDGPHTWTEAQVRMVAAVGGLALLLITLLFTDALGRIGTAWAMIFMAASPMMVFYSRYFIMEILLVALVALSLASFWRYSQSGARGWLLLGGGALGFQHATKETFVLNVGAALCGWIAARVLAGEFVPRRSNGFSFGNPTIRGRTERPWLWVLVPAVLVSILAFSEGFRDWQAVKDSVLTYGNYVERSGGSGHEKPMSYYLMLIFGHRDKVIWSEGMIGGLGLIGMLYAFLGDHKNGPRHAFLVFLSVYTLALFTVYSILSYKTPWSILSAQYALTLLAGVGGGAIWNWLSNRMARFVVTLLFLAGVWNLCDQTSTITGSHPKPSFELSADPSNPYAYSHTLPKVLKLVAEVKRIAAERGDAFSAQVVSVDQGWPLPWYWRNLPQIGYQAHLPRIINAPVVLLDAEFVEAAKIKMAGQGYDQGTGYGLRPGVMLVMFVKQPPAPPLAPAISLPPTPLPIPAESATGMPQTMSAPPPAFSPTLPAFPGTGTTVLPAVRP
ncbi:MAG: TIGR03663 family protein [Prosthecobacter sp.]|nr:TIGR03663 family protein [Prosthecobacter sp.]